jgi:hypothetical protein
VFGRAPILLLKHSSLTAPAVSTSMLANTGMKVLFRKAKLAGPKLFHHEFVKNKA